jgi:hypothetical protein
MASCADRKHDLVGKRRGESAIAHQSTDRGTDTARNRAKQVSSAQARAAPSRQRQRRCWPRLGSWNQRQTDTAALGTWCVRGAGGWPGRNTPNTRWHAWAKRKQVGPGRGDKQRLALLCGRCSVSMGGKRAQKKACLVTHAPSKPRAASSESVSSPAVRLPPSDKEAGQCQYAHKHTCMHEHAPSAIFFELGLGSLLFSDRLHNNTGQRGGLTAALPAGLSEAKEK